MLCARWAESRRGVDSALTQGDNRTRTFRVICQNCFELKFICTESRSILRSEDGGMEDCQTDQNISNKASGPGRLEMEGHVFRSRIKAHPHFHFSPTPFP